MITRIVGLLSQLLRDVIKEVLITAAQIVLRLCHHWVRTRWEDPSANYAADIIYLFGLNLCQGRMKIRVQTTEYISAWIINHLLNVTGIALTLCSTSWSKLGWDEC